MAREIRIRNVSLEMDKGLQELAKEFGMATDTAIISKLITKHKSDQEFMKQQTKRNAEIHARLQNYIDREAAVEAELARQIREEEEALKRKKQIHQKFKSKKK